jgi:hypothetical protein
MKKVLVLIVLSLSVIAIECDILKSAQNISSESHHQHVKNCSENAGESCQNLMQSQQHVVIVKNLENYLNDASNAYNSYNDRLRHSSILYGIVLLAQDNELNQKCYNEIMQIYAGIGRKEIWAIKSEFQ